MKTNIYIGNDLIEQFKDEAVDVVSSVLDITDITKNTGDYTRTFTVPASKINNKIFKHYYDATIDNSFDARTRVAGRIEIDGFLFKKGKWRLSKVAVKKGKPSAYTINFFGNLPSLKDIVKKDLLSDLDLSAFDHDYDSTNVLFGLIAGLFSADVIYTLLPKKRYIYNDDVNDNTQFDSIANIAFGGGAATGVIWSDLRASIKLIKILEAIETDYNLTFSRDFFGTTEFTQLYMWLNPDKDSDAGGGTQGVDFDGGDSFWMNHSTDIGSYDTFSEPNHSVVYDLRLTITPAAGYESVPYTIIASDSGESIQENEYLDGEEQTQLLFLTSADPKTFLISYTIKSEQEFVFSASLKQIEVAKDFLVTVTTTRITTASQATILSIFVISEELPKMKIIDFLKGLFNMFKLVIVAQDDGTYFVDTLDSFYATGELYDVTKYIDFESFDVERGVILNEIELKFKEPTTLLNIEFEKNNGRFYGDIEKTLEDDSGELLDGDTLTFELPFEQVLYERLTDQNSGNTTDIQYGAIIDEDLEPANPKAHIFYGAYTYIGNTPIAFITDVNARLEITTYLWTSFHHYGIQNPNYSTIFNREFSTWDGVAIEKTLYLNHYDTYVSNIFNIKKRTFKYSAQLPVHIITKLELNDTLRIKNDYYRIDKYNYNLLTGKTTFSLINNFDRSINPLSTRNTSINVDFRVQTETIIVNNSSSIVPSKIDNGFGTGWITLTISGDKTNITYTENNTDETRSMFLQYISGGETVTIFTVQELKKPTYDSTTITFDSTKLTFDNA